MLDEREIGRRKGLQDAIGALKTELRMVRTALVATVDEQLKDKLIDRSEVWIAAIELLELQLDPSS